MILNTKELLFPSTLYLSSYEVLLLENNFIQSCCTDLEKMWKEFGWKLPSSGWSRMQASNILSDCQSIRTASASLSGPITIHICASAADTHSLSAVLCISSILLKAAVFLFLSVLLWKRGDPYKQMKRLLRFCKDFYPLEFWPTTNYISLPSGLEHQLQKEKGIITWQSFPLNSCTSEQTPDKPTYQRYHAYMVRFAPIQSCNRNTNSAVFSNLWYKYFTRSPDGWKKTYLWFYMQNKIMVSKIFSEDHRYWLHQLSHSETIFKVCDILSKYLFLNKKVILSTVKISEWFLTSCKHSASSWSFKVCGHFWMQC